MNKSTKRLKPHKGYTVAVALNSPVHKENLPLPFVHYPNHYGTFFMFSEQALGQAYFCECSKQAINNYFHLCDFERKNIWSDEKISSPLSSHFFPNRISELSLKSKNIEEIINFAPKLCHRCNLTTPSLRYCHEMYGGNFKQFYGWYINLNELRIGCRNSNYISSYTPDEYTKYINEIKLIKDKRNQLAENAIVIGTEEFEQVRELEKQVGKLERALYKKYENITREDFGFRKVGEGNVSETILVNIVSKIFANNEMLTHHRPVWLEGLELDIYLSELKIGIEYQGQQHFHAIKAWGGEKALLELRKRDERKRTLCKKVGIELIEIDYTEPLEFNYIKEKILIDTQ